MKKQKKPVPSAEAEPVIKKQPLLKRLLFGPEKPDLSELEAGSTTILDILSPTAVDTKSRDYIVVDGVFHAYLYITGYGYSTTVGSCWLAPLVEAGEGVNISFSFTRQNREKILSKIAQTTMLNRSRMRDVGDTRQDYEELDSAITSGLYLKDVMNRQGEDFYYMHTLIEVVADDPDTLEQRVTAVEKLCVSVDMIARRCDYANEQGFLSTLPLVALDADIERKSRRNALTTGVAAAFPFVSYEHSDRNGIFLGLNLYNKSPVFLDPYDDYKYTNGNWWIGGNSGAGKSVRFNVWPDACVSKASVWCASFPRKATSSAPTVSSWAAYICACPLPRGTAPTSWLSAARHWTPMPEYKSWRRGTTPCWRTRSPGSSSGTPCKRRISRRKTRTIWTPHW